MDCPYRQETTEGTTCIKFDDVPDCLKDYPHFKNRVCILCPDSYYNDCNRVKRMENEIKKLPLMDSK